MIINEEKLVKDLAMDLLKPLKEYRKEKRFAQVKGIEIEDRYGNTVAPSNPCDYWKYIIRAKLSVINCIGGKELASKICIELMSTSDEIEFQLSGAFDYLAEGIISGWYM